ncbi:hypothetical protein [Trichothermofontia sp.]
MKWISYLASCGSTALLLVSCGGTPPSDVVEQPSDTTPIASATTTPPVAAGALPAVAQIPMSGAPYVPATHAPAKPGQAKAESPGLLQPVTATERLPKVRVGRQDPFAPVATKAIVVATQQPTAVAVPNLPPPTLSPPELGLPALPTLPTTTAALPDGMMPAPPARLADEIAILGVVSVSGRVSAIVQVPNESTSRYVHEGEFLAGGRLWVKRIDPGEMGDPIVVLEEAGVEVFRGIGPGLSQTAIGHTPDSSESLPILSVS